MLGPLEARALLQEELQDTPRARHSLFVAYLMHQLAEFFNEDEQLWEVVGLCHDLDYFVTRSDPTQHGLVASTRLRHVLPPIALDAIAAHDHRTGVVADTQLADMLKAADVLAVIEARLGRDWLSHFESTAEPTYARLQSELGDRPYLIDVLNRHATKHDLTLRFLLRLLLGGPPQ
jgi:HD superfamily phosphodiesterase